MGKHTQHPANAAPCDGGYRGCEGYGPLVVDPYDADVNNRITYEHLCDTCYQERSDDI